ncbi:MAG: 3',5'-cyclic-nucleotide phosphodiesterase [Gammaproteobacteria bacterium]|nr:3',5'-cyclic-nucleotide phosphodiesterase [Gammaproteobacteria bacterium]
MNVRVLGASGGVGPGLKTTSLLIDDDILIDAGSGVGELSLEQMASIRHIFITHSHLDHVAFLPLLLDSVFDSIREPVLVHGQAATLRALQEHIFNWVIWPDFSRLPQPDTPVMRYEVMAPGEVCTIAGRALEMIAVNHAVPGVGYHIESPGGALAFSGDTTTNDSFWAALNARQRLDVLIVESAFANANLELSRLACHYCPVLLAEDIAKLRHDPVIYITHNKPGDEETIFAECQAAMPQRNLRRLGGGEIIPL